MFEGRVKMCELFRYAFYRDYKCNYFFSMKRTHWDVWGYE